LPSSSGWKKKQRSEQFLVLERHVLERVNRAKLKQVPINDSVLKIACERLITALTDQKVPRAAHIPTTEMLADGLTKPLPKEAHMQHAEWMGLELRTTHKCNVCEEYFLSKLALTKHITEKHGKNAE